MRNLRHGRIARSRRTRPASKLQRWIDLIAALLSRRYAVALEELLADVPGYQHASVTTRRRMFERDKADLRRLGVPIKTIALDDGESAAYQLRTHDFYLPYLAEGGPRARVTSKRVDRYGYRALPTLVFEPEELGFVFAAAERLRLLESGSLSDAAVSALRKLRFDSPVAVLHEEAGYKEHVIAPRSLPRADVLDALIDALNRRKQSEIDYHSIGVDRFATRVIEPYGLFLVAGNWYLAARDAEKDAIRTFRVSRISRVHTNARRPRQADFTIPANFVLRDYARSRQAWEIGDGEALLAIVEFHGESGTVAAAARLGRLVHGSRSQRAFDVRRIDAFARWLLSFAGDAIPVSPPEVVTAFRKLARATAAIYNRSPNPTDPAIMDVTSSYRGAAGKKDKGGRALSDNSAAQFLRLVAVLPVIASEEAIELKEVAARTGIPAETVIQDLRALVDRSETPPGFIDAVTLGGMA